MNDTDKFQALVKEMGTVSNENIPRYVKENKAKLLEHAKKSDVDKTR